GPGPRRRSCEGGVCLRGGAEGGGVAYVGFYGQQEVAWRNKLFLTGGVRYDASSTFAPSERWQAFPKLSASYVAVENKAGLLNSLRLRSALGWAGSQPSIVNAYSQFITYPQLPFAGR